MKPIKLFDDFLNMHASKHHMSREQFTATYLSEDLVESTVFEKREDVGKYNTVKKVIAKLGRRPSEQDLASFINNNYYDVTEVERGDDDPSANDKIADLVAFYKFDIDDWEIAWFDAQNESVDEATFRPNSGTMSGGTYNLDNRKYELKKDVEGVQIGDYTNIVLPKGTIIYNIPGGVFADHSSLKRYENRSNKYFNKSTFKGISIIRKKETIFSIDKNSKILESLVTERKTISSSKISMMGAKILSKLSIGTIFDTEDGEYEITDYGQQSNAFKEFEAEHNGKKVKVKLTAMYGVKLEVTDDVRSARFNKEVRLNSIILESVVTEAEKYITDEFKVGDKIKTNFGEWEVIEIDYAPKKSFIAPFIFKGKDMKRVNIPNPPKTNKNAVGYKVTDGAKYPTIGFLYQYKDITKLATVGVDESVMNESYKGNFTDFKYDLEMAIDNMDISPKSIKSVKKKGKGYEVRLSSYMSDKSTWEKIGDTIGATLISFKPGSINIGIYE